MEPIQQVNENDDKENYALKSAKNIDGFPKPRNPKLHLADVKVVRQSLTAAFRSKVKPTTFSRIRETLNGAEQEETTLSSSTRKTIYSQPKAKIPLSNFHQPKSRRSLTLNVNPLKVVISSPQLQRNDAVEAGLRPKFKRPAEKFQCNVCQKTFLLKTTLIEHQKCHSGVNSNCPYCQRAFAKPVALSKHLRENCTKISAVEKRKLLEKDKKLAESNQTKQTSYPKSPDMNMTTLASQNSILKTPMKGVYQTPRKPIKCIYCGETFMDAVSFAFHAESCEFK